jgi:hypothetical protein
VAWPRARRWAGWSEAERAGLQWAGALRIRRGCISMGYWWRVPTPNARNQASSVLTLLRPGDGLISSAPHSVPRPPGTIWPVGDGPAVAVGIFWNVELSWTIVPGFVVVFRLGFAAGFAAADQEACSWEQVRFGRSCGCCCRAAASRPSRWSARCTCSAQYCNSVFLYRWTPLCFCWLRPSFFDGLHGPVMLAAR